MMFEPQYITRELARLRVEQIAHEARGSFESPPVPVAESRLWSASLVGALGMGLLVLGELSELEHWADRAWL